VHHSLFMKYTNIFLSYRYFAIILFQNSNNYFVNFLHQIYSFIWFEMVVLEMIFLSHLVPGNMQSQWFEQKRIYSTIRSTLACTGMSPLIALLMKLTNRMDLSVCEIKHLHNNKLIKTNVIIKCYLIWFRYLK
jgi:hypothetical protein